MPIDKTRTGKEHDKRIKIPQGQHLYIVQRHKQGESIHTLAKSYGVDRRLIQFIIYPERKAHSIQIRKARGGSKKYYDKDKHRENMRKHRAYKKSLLK